MGWKDNMLIKQSYKSYHSWVAKLQMGLWEHFVHEWINGIFSTYLFSFLDTPLVVFYPFYFKAWHPKLVGPIAVEALGVMSWSFFGHHVPLVAWLISQIIFQEIWKMVFYYRVLVVSIFFSSWLKEHAMHLRISRKIQSSFTSEAKYKGIESFSVTVHFCSSLEMIWLKR